MADETNTAVATDTETPAREFNLKAEQYDDSKITELAAQHKAVYGDSRLWW